MSSTTSVEASRTRSAHTCAQLAGLGARPGNPARLARIASKADAALDGRYSETDSSEDEAMRAVPRGCLGKAGVALVAASRAGEDEYARSLREYEVRLDRAVAVLAAHNVVVDSATVRRSVLGSKYCYDVRGLAPVEAHKALRKIMGKALMADITAESVERVQVLAELVKLYGQRANVGTSFAAVMLGSELGSSHNDLVGPTR